MVGKDDIAPLVRPFASTAAFCHAGGLVMRHAADRLRYRRGTRLVMGNALVARLFWSLRQRSVAIRFDAAPEALLVEGGRVAGARLMSSGAAETVRARRGVVLASGGFAGDPAALQRLVGAPLATHPVAFAGASGDGQRLGESVGTALSDGHATPG